MNKKHLVVVCGLYYPAPSPTGQCAERYALLFHDEYDIDFISMSQNGLAETIHLDSGITSHTVSCKRLCLEKQSSGIIAKIVHSYGSMLLFSNLLGNHRWYRKEALKKLEQIHRSHPIDVVFAICSPLAAIWAGVDFKKMHPEVRLCSYTVDPNSTPDRIKPLLHSRDAMLQFENNALRAVDWCLLSEEVYETREDIRKGVEHCTPLPYLMPPFLKDETQALDAKDKLINCVYAGSFYDKIRNPEYLLRTFSSLADEKIKLHLYSKGCEEIVVKYSQSQNINVHGLVPQSELYDIYKKADVLIGVGNAVADFLPSKTFEYIALRKPIIYFNYEGVPNSVLNDYPCCLQLSSGMSTEDSVSRLTAFCEALPQSLVNIEQLERIYKKHSPSSIKEVISKAFNYQNGTVE